MSQGYGDVVTQVPNSGWDERILVMRCGTLVDVFIVVSQRYVIIVDSLIGPATAGVLLDTARAYLRGGRQLLVVNTHADWDHAWGNQVFGGPDALMRVPIVGTRRCAERLRSTATAQRITEMQAREPGRFDGVHPVAPTILFDQQLMIDGGDLTLELFATPGHTEDHLAIFIPEIRMLLAGDAAEMPLLFVRAAADLPPLRDSLRQMAAREPAVALYCHAPVSSGPSQLQLNLAYFDELEQRCRAALARGVPAQPAADDDIEALIAFPFEAVVPAGIDAEPLAEFYRPAHHAAARAMLEYCEKAV